MGGGGLLDVGDVDGLVLLALFLPHEALLAHDHLEGGLEVVLDSSPDDGADPEAGVLGLLLEDAGVDGGVVVEDVLLLYQLYSSTAAVQVGVLLLLGLLHDDSGGTAGGVQ